MHFGVCKVDLLAPWLKPPLLVKGPVPIVSLKSMYIFSLSSVISVLRLAMTSIAFLCPPLTVIYNRSLSLRTSLICFLRFTIRRCTTSINWYSPDIFSCSRFFSYLKSSQSSCSALTSRLTIAASLYKC